MKNIVFTDSASGQIDLIGTKENICANSLFAWTNIATVTSRANYPFLLSVSLFAVDTFEEPQISPFNQKLLSPRGQTKGCRGYAHPWGDLRLISYYLFFQFEKKQSKAKTKQNKKKNKQKQKTLRSFLSGVPLLRKILDPPLACSDWQIYLPRLFTNNRTYLSSGIKYVKDNLFTIDVHTMLIPAFYWQNIKFLIFLLKTY